MNKQTTTFTVEGRQPFPIDMLRYDSCWPKSQHDAAVVGRGRSHGAEVVTVVLETNSNGPTVGRWLSFGFMVLP